MTNDSFLIVIIIYLISFLFILTLELIWLLRKIKILKLTVSYFKVDDELKTGKKDKEKDRFKEFNFGHDPEMK